VIGVLERLDRHFASQCWKLPEELVQGVAAIEVIDEVLERNSGSAEAGCSAHDIRVGHNYACVRAAIIFP